MAEKPHPILARRIFWDVDFDNLDCKSKMSVLVELMFARQAMRSHA